MAKPWHASVGVRAALVTGGFSILSSLILVLGGSDSTRDASGSASNVASDSGSTKGTELNDSLSAARFWMTDPDSSNTTRPSSSSDPAPSVQLDSTEAKKAIQLIQESIPEGSKVIIRIEATDTTGFKILHELKQEHWDKSIEFKIELSKGNEPFQPDRLTYSTGPFLGLGWELAPKVSINGELGWALQLNVFDSIELGGSRDTTNWGAALPDGVQMGFYFN